MTFARAVHHGPPLNLVISIVAPAFGVSVQAVHAMTRDQVSVTARQAAMWLCRRMTSAPYAAIGRAIGDRDHSTVMHGVACTERRIAADPGLAGLLARLEADIERRAAW